MEIGDMIKLSAQPDKKFVVLKSDIGAKGRYVTVLELGPGHRLVPYTLEEILAGPGMTVIGKLRIDAEKLIQENTPPPDDIQSPPIATTEDAEVSDESPRKDIPELKVYETTADELLHEPILDAFEVPDSAVPEDV